MKYFNTLIKASLIACVALMVLVITSTAHAASGFPINIHPAIDLVINYGFVAITAVVLWLVTNVLHRFSKKLGVDVDEKTRAYLDVAIINGLAWAKHRVIKGASNLSDPQVQNLIVATAANYIVTSVPDALAHFKITEVYLTELIEARLPQIGVGDVKSG